MSTKRGRIRRKTDPETPSMLNFLTRTEENHVATFVRAIIADAISKSVNESERKQRKHTS